MRVRKIAASLLVIGMTVQILLGMIWILCNFPSGWMYPESAYYISVAESKILDEYAGILYPALIKGCQVVTGLLGLSFEGLLYLLQIGAAFVCGSAFVLFCRWDRERINSCRRKEFLCAGFGGLYLLTVPLCAQWHLSILPQSFVSSLFLLLLGLCVRATGNRDYCDHRLVIDAGILWWLMTLLAPDYWWLGLIPVLYIAYLLTAKNGLRGLACFLLVAVVASVLSVGANKMVQTPGSSGKIQKTLGAAMVSRMVWPHFYTTYFFWPDEIKEIFTPLECAEISSRADQVALVFGPLTEETYGKEKANEMYWQMAISCLEVRTKEIIQAIVEDLEAYLFAPWQVKTQLDGSGLSYSGWHYDKMKADTPKLTRWYVDYGLVSFRVGLLISAFLLIWRRALRLRSTGGRKTGFVLMAICILSQAIWYTMAGGGMMDYRNVPVVILLWYYVIFYSAEVCLKEQESYEKKDI